MGDRKYFQDQYDSPQSRQPISNLFDMGPSEDGGFSVNTRMPTHGRSSHKSYYDQDHYSETLDSRRDSLSPSYQQSRNDRAFSAGEREKNYAWNYVSNDQTRREDQYYPKSFSNLFDVPGDLEPPAKYTKYSDDDYDFPPKSRSGFDPYENVSPCFEGWSQQTSYQQDKIVSDYRRGDHRSKFRGGRNQRNFRGHGRGRGSEMNPKSSLQGDKPQQSSFQQNKIVSDFRGSSNRSKFRGRNQRNFGGRGHGRGLGNVLKSKSSDQGDLSVTEDIVSKENEQDSDNDEDQGTYEKSSVFCPTNSMVNEKYKYYPPTSEEMGEIFKDMVIFFFYKIKNIPERNPFVVICESFRRSSGYFALDVEDGYGIGHKDRKFCTLRYRNMMMARGVGENRDIKEARVLAAVELINQLAMSCYTLEAKPEYYNNDVCVEKKDVPGLYRVLTEDEVPTLEAACQLLIELAKDDSDVEYIFILSKTRTMRLKGWASKNGYSIRMIKLTYLAVCVRRSPQYWRDKILASGSMETERYTLKPPQGIGNLLMPNVNVTDYARHLEKRTVKPCTLKVKYGPKGVGPDIQPARPPWTRKRRSDPRKINLRMNQIKQAVMMGQPLKKARGYKKLSMKNRSRLRKEIRGK